MHLLRYCEYIVWGITPKVSFGARLSDITPSEMVSVASAVVRRSHISN